MKVLVTGATGLTGYFFLSRLIKANPNFDITLVVRDSSRQVNKNLLTDKTLKVTWIKGDTAHLETWKTSLLNSSPEIIVHIASIRHTPVILESLESLHHKPHLIVVGTTGVYSQYNQYSRLYRLIEGQLKNYQGTYCLLRPTMIYGSSRDKNLHKLIKFCAHYSFFPVFGSGKSLLQPVHADDLAWAILTTLLNPQIQGTYDISGGTALTFLELLVLIEKLLGKSVYPLRVPYSLGLWSVTLIEALLRRYTPIRREQILRLQEDKAYPYIAAQKDFGYNPRPIEVGLAQEIELLRLEGII